MTSPGEPLTLRSVTARNRLWMSPMCQYSSPQTGLDIGAVTDWHVSHLEARAVGGVGLVMTEAAAVDPAGRVSPTDLGIWSDDHVPGLSRVTAAIARHGAIPALQLGHAGPKASTCQPWLDRRRRVPESEGGWIPWSPSPRVDGQPVEEPDEAALARLPDLYAAAAARALRAGFEALEVHAAHGYLLHAFQSPLTNMRRDGYGVDRTRLLREVVQGVRSTWPAELPLLVRITGTDWLEGGLVVGDAIALTREILPLGVDLIDVSSGGLLPASIDVHPGYQVPFASAVRRSTGAVVSAVGIVEEPEHVRQILGDGHADVVFAGRALLRDPNWARTVLRTVGDEPSWPVQYAWAIDAGR